MRLAPATAVSGLHRTQLSGSADGRSVDNRTGIQPAVGVDFQDCMRLYLTGAGRLATYNACAAAGRNFAGWFWCATHQPHATVHDQTIIAWIYDQCDQQHPAPPAAAPAA
jgi:hypothetical protein